MLIGALIIYLTTLFGGGGTAMGPILAEVKDARDRVRLVADTKDEREAITARLDAVLEASESRTHDIEKLSAQLRMACARHNATREEILRAVSALRDAANAELSATMEAYYELRESLSSEQWATLFPPPPAAAHPAHPAPHPEEDS